MVDPDLGLTIVFNGCIYNYPELREELSGAGYRFFSTSDTEVLLKAYHHWGERFVERLKGMFAFCIVERDSGRAILGRDRLGIKPLYIAETADSLRFASTLPALVAGGGVDTPAARGRGIFREEYVERLLKAPNDERTRLESNKLWQVGLLELWLQARGI